MESATLDCQLSSAWQKKLDNQKELSASVSLPPVLYKAHEIKGDETPVNEGQTWLADESISSHFESLKLETNGSVLSKIADDDDMKDSETDGNEVPLGKMIKRLRAKGMKARKVMKDESSPSKSKMTNDIDILQMVRDMDLDIVGKSDKFESSGHDYARGKSNGQNPKKNKRKTSESASVPVPKRRRSSSAQAHHKVSLAKGVSKSAARPLAESLSQDVMSSSESAEMVDKLRNDSEEKASQENTKEAAETELLASSIPKSSKTNGSGSSKDRNWVHRLEESSDHDQKRRDTDGTHAGTDIKLGPVRKRKRRSVAGLAKCSSKKGKNPTADLVDCRIKVWWPMDKQFYEGVVKSYDQNKNKYVIKYDDGDVEVLCLDKERWELVSNGRKAIKRISLSKSRPAKGLSSEKRKKSPNRSRESKRPIEISPSSKVRGKRTPRKNLKHGQKVVSKSVFAAFGEESKKQKPGKSDFEPVTSLKADDTETEEEPSDGMEENLSGDEDSIKHGISEGHGVDAESNSSDTEKTEEDPDSGERDKENAAGTSHAASGSDDDVSRTEETQEPESRENSIEDAGEMEKSDSEGIQADDADSPSDGADESDRIHSAAYNSEAEISDNEPLGAWKRKAGKSAGK